MSRAHFILIAALSTAGMSGCVTSLDGRARNIQKADKTLMTERGCTMIGSVNGFSSLTNAAAGKENAATEALNEAAKMGATHLIIKDAEIGRLKIIVPGDAYKCS